MSRRVKFAGIVKSMLSFAVILIAPNSLMLAQGQSDMMENVEAYQGELFTITLPENPTTGYSWVATIENNYLQQIEKSLTSIGTEDGPSAGTGGIVKFTFKALKIGNTSIGFSKERADGDIKGRKDVLVSIISYPEYEIINNDDGEILIKVYLEENFSSTGYSWKTYLLDDAFLTLISEDVIQNTGDDENPGVGSAGKKVFVFKVLENKRGSIEIVFALHRNWDIENPIQEYKTITVELP